MVQAAYWLFFPSKVTGYLNLLANVVDNFLHGLAVGSSFLVSYRVRGPSVSHELYVLSVYVVTCGLAVGSSFLVSYRARGPSVSHELYVLSVCVVTCGLAVGSSFLVSYRARGPSVSHELYVLLSVCVVTCGLAVGSSFLVSYRVRGPSVSHELYVLSVCVTCCGQQFPCQLQGTGAECVPRVVCVTECLCCDLWTCCGQQFPCQLQGTGAECVPRVVCPKCLCDLLWAAASLSATGHGGRVCPTSCMF